ncbi:hydrogenase maturation protease [Chloroflexus sp.]|uniref:hydrogenase maturation protease n=1 Tax=Chloroflexus sp. TaxID=1904827 RepID=UPI002ADE5071|nr:hydrogenase maturation protease [Chloroflexus sp.]
MGSICQRRCPVVGSGGLVIGYGSPLRGDDYAGQAAAARLRQWRMVGVQVIARAQLTPELAAVIAQARRVVFLDAAIDRTDVDVRVIEPALTLNDSHRSDPPALLALARVLYGRVPRAVLITIPAYDTTLNLSLSPATERAVAHAARLARAFLGRRYWALQERAVGQ